MQITRLGHSCLHVVDRDADLLVDPGVFSSGFEDLTGLTGILITHQHADHLDLDRLPAVLEANPGVRVYADRGAAAQLAENGIEATAVAAGDSFDVGTPVTVHGIDHAVIYREIPIVPNASYLIGERLLHPGDALMVPDVPVEILAVPAAAPWMALKEAIDYLRTVHPTVAFPIHDGVVNPPALPIYYGQLGTFAPEGTSWLALGGTESVGV
ncbi:MBL fold metallo-hydrolase [Nakamurella endophytica]|uniref:MBL fold metallo-hydrolase n=1 Tax=Nakamurella endophytica TaxID=1748367 RepID=A0A917T669_9ACTN|nr:MBL fold metallo-hydrolase [Nakamurella endophytica]GGM11207.1 MBL fold metallo-hydrolase [Nakamurella endophytica]